MANQRTRKEGGKWLLCCMTLASLEKPFTDEKIFKLQAPNNKQNDIISVVSLRGIRKDIQT